MKHKSAPEENDTQQQTVDGPGSQLRKARERKGLDQAKMAAQLHLSKAMIEALEWDDYEKLPAAVFVQGYLKNYARLLDVDESAVIRAYQDLQPEAGQQPLPRNQPDEVARELHSDHGLIRYISWAVLVVLGVLIFFWWQGRMQTPEPPVTSDADQEMGEPGFSTVFPEEPELPTTDRVLSPIREPATAPPTTEAPVTSMPEPAVPAEPPVLPSAVEAESVESETVLEAEPRGEQSANPMSDAGASSSEADEPRTLEPESIASGVVVFEFSGPCWVEVRDVNGRARIIGVMRDGVRRSLDAGLGPFRVVIGDIQAASLTVNGEAYDLGRHTRGKVARFTLDPSAL